MKAKIKSRYMLGIVLLLGIALPPLAEAQWVPFTAEFREQIYRPLPDGTEELVAQSTGVLYRNSSGSEMRTVMGAAQQKKRSLYKDAATGKVHQINHNLRESRVVRQLSLPLLPNPNFILSESNSGVVGTQVINGVECIGLRVKVNDQFVPGVHWISSSLRLIVKEDVTFPNGARRVVEFYNFQYTEPSPTRFEIPAGYSMQNSAPSP